MIRTYSTTSGLWSADLIQSTEYSDSPSSLPIPVAAIRCNDLRGPGLWMGVSAICLVGEMVSTWTSPCWIPATVAGAE